jgi:hypothetical protein
MSRRMNFFFQVSVPKLDHCASIPLARMASMVIQEGMPWYRDSHPVGQGILSGYIRISQRS